MQNSKSTVVFFSIILMIGVLTVITDLQSKKIYNTHLVIGAVGGLAGLIYTAVWAHENYLFHIINGLIAFAVGYCLHRFGLWKGGDAKLFTLYAFLMPELERGHVLLSGAINLFACSFIAGAIVLTPVFIKDIASNYDAVINKFLSPKKRLLLLSTTATTIGFSWVLSPLYHFIGVLHMPVFLLLATYIIFTLSFIFVRKIEPNYVILLIVVGLGVITHLWFDPDSFSWPSLTYSIFRIGLFSSISAVTYFTLDLLKEYHDRIPFAPLLFTGCVLSYTPFLTWIRHLVPR